MWDLEFTCKGRQAVGLVIDHRVERQPGCVLHRPGVHVTDVACPDDCDFQTHFLFLKLLFCGCCAIGATTTKKETNYLHPHDWRMTSSVGNSTSASACPVWMRRTSCFTASWPTCSVGARTVVRGGFR